MHVLSILYPPEHSSMALYDLPPLSLTNWTVIYKGRVFIAASGRFWTRLNADNHRHVTFKLPCHRFSINYVTRCALDTNKPLSAYINSKSISLPSLSLSSHLSFKLSYLFTNQPTKLHIQWHEPSRPHESPPVVKLPESSVSPFSLLLCPSLPSSLSFCSLPVLFY
jgi:hypothetical protein